MKKIKAKTHKATAKRFKLSGTGKVMRTKLQGKNNTHRKNKAGRSRVLVPESFQIKASAEVKKIKRLLNK
jgi:large subunit ribosomal protein L35